MKEDKDEFWAEVQDVCCNLVCKKKKCPGLTGRCRMLGGACEVCTSGRGKGIQTVLTEFIE